MPQRIHILERTQTLPLPPPDVFSFFEDATNLERITPPSLRFRIVTPTPIEMRAGALIDYRLRLHGVPIGWRTIIDLYEPPHRFVDRQLSGPYVVWKHLHTFEDVGQGRTRMNDRIEYALPLGFLGDVAHELFVRRSLKEIFDYRRDVIEQIFSKQRP